MSILSVDNISPIGSGTSVTVNKSVTLESGNTNITGVCTATSFVGNLTGTINTAAQGNITSLGTLSGLVIDNNANTSMSSSPAGQLVVGGDGYTGAVALDADAMHIYHNSSSRALVFGTNETERLRITGAGLVGISTNAPSAALLDIATSSGSNDHLRLRRISSDSNIASNWSFKPYGGHLYFREGGSTDKIQFMNGGDLYILDGNLRVASGHGIDFAATADTGATGASSSSELLDDYEEGSWTPVIKGSSNAGTATYVSRTARYVKIGRLVHIYSDVRWSAHSGSGGLEVHGLPYPQVGGYWGHFGVNYNSGMSYATDVHYGWANIGGDYIRYWETNSSGGSGTLALDSVVGEVHFYGHYLTST